MSHSEASLKVATPVDAEVEATERRLEIEEAEMLPHELEAVQHELTALLCEQNAYREEGKMRRFDWWELAMKAWQAAMIAWLHTNNVTHAKSVEMHNALRRACAARASASEGHNHRAVRAGRKKEVS